MPKTIHDELKLRIKAHEDVLEDQRLSFEKASVQLEKHNYHAILNTLSEQIAVLDKDGTMEWVNKAWVNSGPFYQPKMRSALPSITGSEN